MGQPFLDLSQTIPSEIRVAVVAQPVSTEKKKLGYTFGNHGCSGCSTGFNHSRISPKLYLRKSGLQWLLNRFQPKKKIGVYLRKSGLQWLLNQFQPFLDLSQTIPSEIRVAVVAQPVSTIPGSLPNYTFGNQGCSGCSTSFNHSWISPKLYLRKSGLQWFLNQFQPKKKLGYTFGNQGCSGCSTGFNHSWISPKLYLRKSGLQWLLNRFQPKKKLGCTFGNHGC